MFCNLSQVSTLLFKLISCFSKVNTKIRQAVNTQSEEDSSCRATCKDFVNLMYYLLKQVEARDKPYITYLIYYGSEGGCLVKLGIDELMVYQILCFNFQWTINIVESRIFTSILVERFQRQSITRVVVVIRFLIKFINYDNDS